MLSFGEEAEAEEQAVETVKAKIKSSHDVLQDPRLLKDATDSAEMVRTLAHQCFKCDSEVRSEFPQLDLRFGSYIVADERDYNSLLFSVAHGKVLSTISGSS